MAQGGLAVDEKRLGDWEQALAALEDLPEPARRA
jgi:hypothetical protein